MPLNIVIDGREYDVKMEDLFPKDPSQFRSELTIKVSEVYFVLQRLASKAYRAWSYSHNDAKKAKAFLMRALYDQAPEVMPDFGLPEGLPMQIPNSGRPKNLDTAKAIIETSPAIIFLDQKDLELECDYREYESLVKAVEVYIQVLRTYLFQQQHNETINL